MKGACSYCLVRPRPIEHRDPIFKPSQFHPCCNCIASRAAPAERAREDSLSDSHDCEKLPCRGAVEVERCCRDAVGGGKERFNRIVKGFPKCVRLGCASLELSEPSVLGAVEWRRRRPVSALPATSIKVSSLHQQQHFDQYINHIRWWLMNSVSVYIGSALFLASAGIER